MLCLSGFELYSSWVPLNTEFNCWLVVIVFSYDDPLSVQETTIANRGNIFGNYFTLYLSLLKTESLDNAILAF